MPNDRMLALTSLLPDLAMNAAYVRSPERAAFAKFCACLAVSFAAAAAPSTARVEWRKPVAGSGFGGLSDEFRRLATEQGSARVNHFCAVIRDEHGSRGASGDRSLEVYWPEGNRLLRYGPSPNGRIDALSQDAGATVNLRTDVVSTEKDIAGSATRVTRAYVNALIDRCRRIGTTFTVFRRQS